MPASDNVISTKALLPRTARFLMNRTLSLITCFCLIWAFAADARAQQFRIETEVLVGDSVVPSGKSLTLFDGPMVYDFMMSESAIEDERVSVGGGPKYVLEEIVIFDSARQKIILLDQRKRRRMELTQIELLNMAAAMKASEVLREKDLALLEPELLESFDATNSEIKLASPRITYTCQGESISDAKTLVNYYQFADWAARLNVSDSQKLPPFARLKLNDVIRKKGWMPSQVTLTLVDRDGGQMNACAKHHVIYKLSENDQIRINNVKKQWADFPLVSLIEYRNLKPAASDHSE